jgi:microcin C transport system permease protein
MGLVRLALIPLVLVASHFLAARLIPWLLVAALRLLGFRTEMSPVTRKRISRFKRIKRGYWSFIAIVALFTASLFLELLVNGKALAIHYQDRTAFPAVADWASKVFGFAGISSFQKASDFGQKGESEVDYRLFSRHAAHPEMLGKEIEEERAKIAAERADLADPTKARTPGDKIRAISKRKALDRREADVAQLERALPVLSSGQAWCIMPIYPYGPTDFRLDPELKPPASPSIAAGVPLGTDTAGRDVLVLLLYGFRISLAFSLLVAAIGYAVGVVVGGLQGYFGGWVDIILQRIEEVWSSIPFLFTIMIIASMITPSFTLLLGLMVVLVSWLGITQYIRAEFYREKAKDYVQAAIGMGVADWKIMLKHILPNSIVPIVTFAPFAIVGYISSLVSLDYLGFGLPPGTPSWGDLLHQGLDNIKFHPHLTIVPTAALVLTLFAVVLIGEAVREAFDPKVFSRLR